MEMLTIVSSMSDAEAGALVQKLLTERGWSQRKLESKAGLSVGYVSTLIAGNQRPKAETWQKIADAFMVPVETFTGGPQAQPYLAHQEVFRVIQTAVKPEEIPAFVELVREWSEWSDEYRGTVILLGRMKIKDRRKKGNVTRIWTDVQDEEREER